MKITSTWMHKGVLPLLKRLSYLKELLSYAMLCPYSSSFEIEDGSGSCHLSSLIPLHWSRQFEYPWILHNIQRDHQCALDVGGGFSVLGYALAKRIPQVYSIDIANDSVEKARESARIIGAANLRAECGDARNTTFPDHYFDLVVCSSVLEHVPPQDGDKIIKEIDRVLCPGGRAMFTMDVKLSGDHEKDFYLTPNNVPFPIPSASIPLVCETDCKNGEKVTLAVLLVTVEK